MSTKAKFDAYQVITDTFIEALEAIDNGEQKAPAWVRPWSSIGAPRNMSGHVYRGMNALLTAFKMSRMGWDDPRFATFNQIKKLGGNVKKGEKGTMVTLWKFIEDKKNPGKTIPLLRTFTVFNVKAQAEGIELKELVSPNTDERNTQLDAFIGETGAVIGHGGDRAYYSPSDDKIQMPTFESFKSSDAYYSTVFHELGHWTGAEERLDRDLSGRFGSESYAMEELVAELTNAFLCQTLGVDGEFQDNHLPYVKSWLKVLKDDKRAIFRASSLANTAAKFLLGEIKEEIEEEETTEAS